MEVLLQVIKQWCGGGGGLCIYNSNCVLVRTEISRNTAAGGGGGGLYLRKDGSSGTMTVDIRETTFTANKGGNNNEGNEIYTEGTPTISIVNTLFNQPIDSNNNFYEDNGATWNTCANNVCTATPFTGTCTAVNNANTKYGVLCHYNNYTINVLQVHHHNSKWCRNRL